MENIEPFVEWLRVRGTPEQQLDAHRHYASTLAKHPSLSAALRSEEEAGATPKRLMNLRQVAARLAEFEAARSREGEVATPAIPPVDLTMLEVEATSKARPAASPFPQSKPPRRGCGCREHQDTYLDTDFGSLAQMIGGGVGIGTILLIRLLGVLGAVAIALGLAGLGGLATIWSICHRCYGCRRPVHDLDVDERIHLRKGRALVTLVTLGFLAGAAVCGFIWWSVVASKIREPEFNPDRLEQSHPSSDDDTPEPENVEREAEQ